MPDPRSAFLEHFRWEGHHADLWRIFRHPVALSAVVSGLAEPFREIRPDAVIGIESRGFLLGGAVAVQLGAGFVAVRKDTGLFPGPKVRRRTDPDYRGHSHELRLRTDDLRPGDRAVLVDDWVETGAQAAAVAALVGEVGAELIGIAVVVDELAEAMRPRLPPVQSLVAAADLPAFPS
ncbi:MAG TPA: phosphoribosyltransferase family protein [Mycobacteriales bacterium]|nr:phosphoribosyltransferase family protein [Mycobacteriales bacterium]